MADTQITILGMSGSGKTCYLVGLYYKMSSGMKGFTIKANDDADVELRNLYRNMLDSSRGSRRFPAGTNEISEYTFELQHGYNPVMSFDWVDYPGGWLDTKLTGNIENYKQITQAINNSSSLFICVDGALLDGEDIDDKIDNIRDNCSNVINTFFSDYFQNNKRLPPTAIIVTKYDLCTNNNSEEDIENIIKEAFSPFFTKSKDNVKRIVAIIPISVGRNIADEDCSGKLRPINIHKPIFMSILFALEHKIRKTNKYFSSRSKNYLTRINDFQNEYNKEGNSFILFRNKNKMNYIKSMIQNLSEVSEKEKKEYEYLLEVMTDNKDKILNELNDVDLYNNGVKTTFSDIFNENN